MYCIPATKTYLANLINASQTQTGAPIKLLNLAPVVTAFAQQPRAFTHVVNANAVAIVDIPELKADRWLGPRGTRGITNDPTTGVATAGYISNSFAGRIKIHGAINVLVQVSDTIADRGGSNRDYLMAGIAETLLTVKLGIQLTDPLSLQNFTILKIGEDFNLTTLNDERLPDSKLFLYSGIVRFEDIEIDVIA